MKRRLRTGAAAPDAGDLRDLGVILFGQTARWLDAPS
jgi:hypothetical protein